LLICDTDGRGNLENTLCRELSNACAKKVPPITSRKDYKFVVKSADEVQMDKTLRSMRDMPGMQHAKVYSRDEYIDKMAEQMADGMMEEEFGKLGGAGAMGMEPPIPNKQPPTTENSKEKKGRTTGQGTTGKDAKQTSNVKSSNEGGGRDRAKGAGGSSHATSQGQHGLLGNAANFVKVNICRIFL
jgi:hypothetical protein